MYHQVQNVLSFYICWMFSARRENKYQIGIRWQHDHKKKTTKNTSLILVRKCMSKGRELNYFSLVTVANKWKEKGYRQHIKHSFQKSVCIVSGVNN
jgi:hypothetical protein